MRAMKHVCDWMKLMRLCLATLLLALLALIQSDVYAQTIQDLQKQCDRGNAAECTNLGFMY